MPIAPDTMLLRMAISAVLGAAVGYERERSEHPAGLRTHILVSLASATFMLVSTQFVYFQHYAAGGIVTVDTSRIAASVVTGVGFLGAGAILRTGLNVQGLTTAASLWLVSAVGLAAGGGMFLEALAATGITLFSLISLRRVEGKRWRVPRRRVSIMFEDATVGGQAIVEQLRAMRTTVTNVDYDRNMKTHRSQLHFDVHVQDPGTIEQVLAHLEALPNVRRVQIQRLIEPH